MYVVGLRLDFPIQLINLPQSVRAAAYRENVANEIFQTEKDYVANLGLLFDTFLYPIKEHMTGIS